MENTMPRWLSIRQACWYMDISKPTLYEHIRVGDIYSFQKKLGSKRYVDRLSIDAFLEGKEGEIKREAIDIASQIQL